MFSKFGSAMSVASPAGLVPAFNRASKLIWGLAREWPIGRRRSVQARRNSYEATQGSKAAERARPPIGVGGKPQERRRRPAVAQRHACDHWADRDAGRGRQRKDRRHGALHRQEISVAKKLQRPVPARQHGLVRADGGILHGGGDA